MKRILLTSIIALSTAFGANAELIEADFNSAGDNAAFTDTRTGATFLDLGLTMGQSINQVLQRTQEGGDLEGWRIATADEIDELFFSVTGMYTNGTKTTLRYSNASELNSVAGSGSGMSYGLFIDGNGYSSMMGSNLTFESTMYNNYYRSASLDWASANHGVFLIDIFNFKMTPPLYFI